MPFPSRVPAAAALQQQGLSPVAANHMLQALYVAAAVLAVILLVAVALAAIAWHKNKDKDLTP